MAGNAILTIEGNAGKNAAIRAMGKSEYYQFSLAVHDRRGSETPPTWYNVNVEKTSKSEKVMVYVKPGSQIRVTGTLKVRRVKDGDDWLDVYVPLEMFAFTGMGAGGERANSTPPQNRKGNDADDPAAAGEDIPF